MRLPLRCIKDVHHADDALLNGLRRLLEPGHRGAAVAHVCLDPAEWRER